MAKIIAAAERRMGEGGFHGFSFREIAADVGVKSASVHHHFPTKEDLAVAVVRAYTDAFMEALGDPLDPAQPPRELLARYVDLFRRALLRDRRMCLCGLLAGETAALPPSVGKETRQFFTRNLAWLEAVLKRQSPRMEETSLKAGALRLVALLEGAMLVAHNLGDAEAFETIAAAAAETAIAPVAEG
jgi:TetR/AcrR family transcriptional repressor of nem operon